MSTADKAAITDLAAVVDVISGGAVTGLYDPQGEAFAEEFASQGWCTAQDYMRVTRELIDRGLAEGVWLRVNPLLHNGDGCRRCAEHEEVYAQDQRDHQRAVERWQAGATAYPYVTSTSSVHLRDCAHITAESAPPAPTLRRFVRCGDYPEQRLVLADDTVAWLWENLEPVRVASGRSTARCLPARRSRRSARACGGTHEAAVPRLGDPAGASE